MGAHDNIEAIQVTLIVGAEHSLFIMLASDGSINRMGTGSVANVDHDLFIGKTDPTRFARLRDQITQELLDWCGRRLVDPQPVGQVCDLSLGFKRTDGRELSTGWRYGSESQGPPTEVRQFVAAAVEATESWFERQKVLASNGDGLERSEEIK